MKNMHKRLDKAKGIRQGIFNSSKEYLMRNAQNFFFSFMSFFSQPASTREGVL